MSLNAENRLVSVAGDATASFVYDGDGKPLGRASRDQIKATVNGTTVYVGNHYEVKNSVVTKYYTSTSLSAGFAGTTRLAVRTDGTLSYLLGDHLGSTSLTTDANGTRTSELRYKAFGETRFSFGTMPTKYQFTGQYAYTDDPSTPQSEGFGLVYFNARWMDPSLGRFNQPDSLVPTSTQGTQAWDRYAYVNNNPIRSTDPTGHLCEDEDLDGHCPGQTPIPPSSQPSYDYHQCMTGCHTGTIPGPTSYVDIRTDIEIDGMSFASGTIGLIGDGATALAILDPVPGDEVVVGGGATFLNVVAYSSTAAGFGIDVYQAIIGEANTLGRDTILTGGPKVLTSILKKVIPTAMEKNPVAAKLFPLVGLPFHIKDIATSINVSSYTIPYTGSVP